VTQSLVSTDRSVQVAGLGSHTPTANEPKGHSLSGAAPLPFVGAVLLAAVLGSCSQELPQCPPGTDFEDCRPSTATGAVQPMAGSGGTSASAQGGTGGAGGSPPVASAGSGSERPPVDEGDDLDPSDTPDPPVDTDPDPPQPTVDNCPDDPAKSAPGVCGCGIPDDNFDGDAALDCVEACPDNAARTTPSGACGCSSLTDTAACTALRNAVRNLYTFDGEGVQILDSLGDADGTLLDDDGATPAADLQRLQVNGRLNLDGFGSFVDLPDGLISSLGSASFEVWVSWRGGAAWPRIFDFGSANAGAGQTYLFLTPSNGNTTTLRAAYSLAGPGAAETLVDGLAALPIAGGAGATLEHVAVVVDDTLGTLRLYLNGAELGAVPLADNLAAINDVNNWLGRSNYAADPPLFGSLVEFRIYDQALTAAQLRTSFQAGPGALN
jgi:hypothetical protein